MSVYFRDALLSYEVTLAENGQDVRFSASIQGCMYARRVNVIE
jgi:hypothetical protein